MKYEWSKHFPSLPHEEVTNWTPNKSLNPPLRTFKAYEKWGVMPCPEAQGDGTGLGAEGWDISRDSCLGGIEVDAKVLLVNLRGCPVNNSAWSLGWHHIMTQLSFTTSWELFKSDLLIFVDLSLCSPRQRLESASDQDLQLYLLQLVQVLWRNFRHGKSLGSSRVVNPWLV